MRRGLLVGCLVLLVVASSYDALREIPPLADDLWMIERAPGELTDGYMAEHGWAGRPLGTVYMDLTSSVASWIGAPTLAVVLFNRIVSLLALFVVLSRVFGLTDTTSLVALTLFALAPPANEGWSMLCTGHLALSVPIMALSCGLYAQALAASASGRRAWRLAAGAFAAQLVTYAFYEQALLAIPAFVGVLMLVEIVMRRVSYRDALAIGAASAVGTAIWIGALLSSGYVASRTEAGSAGAAEVADFPRAAYLLWIGFVQHNVWRAIEFVRTGRVWVWDATALGVFGALALFAIAALIWYRVAGSSGQPSDERPAGALGALPWPALALASLPAAYAALLPLGLAYPGFMFFSRMYYATAFFVALGTAMLAGSAATRWRRLTPVALAVVVLWSGALSRRYMSDMRDGAWVVRDVANATTRIPADAGARGVLVVAPDCTGTFSTSAVQPWSFRAAVHLYTGADMPGPLYFAPNLHTATDPGGKIFDELAHQSDVRTWGAVLYYTGGGVVVAPTPTEAVDLAALERARAGVPER